MNLGDVIKTKRKEHSLTQSGLAEALGVSTQAVSKWERGVGYPDVSLIVPLARILKVSTDTLLDYKDRYNELNRKWQLTCCKYEGGSESIYKLIEIDEQALKEYPDDYTFAYRRVIDKYRAALDEDNVQKRADLLLDSAGNALFALSKFPNDDSLLSALARIYSAREEHDLALEYAYKTKDPQRLLKFILKGEELRRHKQQLISKKLMDLLSELQCEEPDFLDAEERIIKAVIPDGNYVWLYDYLSMVYVHRARIYAKQDNYEKSVEALSCAFSLAREKDDSEVRSFTAPIFDKLDAERDGTSSLVLQISHICKREKAFSAILDDERLSSMFG